MTFVVWSIIGFIIIVGGSAAAFLWAGRDDERNEYSGAVEGDQINFNQRGTSPSGS